MFSRVVQTGRFNGRGQWQQLQCFYGRFDSITGKRRNTRRWRERERIGFGKLVVVKSDGHEDYPWTDLARSLSSMPSSEGFFVPNAPNAVSYCERPSRKSFNLVGRVCAEVVLLEHNTVTLVFSSHHDVLVAEQDTYRSLSMEELCQETICQASFPPAPTLLEGGEPL